MRHRIFLLVTVYLLLVAILGCEAFTRKFIRKPKAEEKKPEEIVLIPQEYNAEGINKEELYREYFLYWESWQDELIDILSSRDLNRKKQVDSLREAVKNLVNMRGLLLPEKQILLDNYINEMNNLSEDITKDIYTDFMSNSLMKAQRIKRKIQRDFSFSKIKDYLR